MISLRYRIDRHTFGAQAMSLMFDIILTIAGSKIIVKRRPVPPQCIDMIQI